MTVLWQVAIFLLEVGACLLGVAVLIWAWLQFYNATRCWAGTPFISEEGVEFPFEMLTLGPYRHWRWSQIRDFSIDEHTLEVLSEGELFLPRKINVELQSGQAFVINLKSLTTAEKEEFLLKLHSFSVPAVSNQELLNKMVEQIREKRLSQQQQASASETKANVEWSSFTNLWEEELAGQTANLSYVPLDSGTKLQSGQLTVSSRIASGGSSTVYLAESDSGNFILKEAVIPHFTDEETRAKAKELFGREAQLLRQLDHPKITKVLDCFTENGRDYLVLEYASGVSLRQYVKQRGPQREEVVLKWAREIAQIFQYLHSQNPPVIHRDLTPDNLVVKDGGSLVLIDFGAANEYIGKATGTLIGKQSYISPEQFRGKAQVASDIYSLGCTLQYALTGSDPEALSESHPKATNAKISEFTDRLVALCTAIDEKKRIGTADELLAKLDEPQVESATVLTTREKVEIS